MIGQQPCCDMNDRREEERHIERLIVTDVINLKTFKQFGC